jgi:hypothetical protein
LPFSAARIADDNLDPFLGHDHIIGDDIRPIVSQPGTVGIQMASLSRPSLTRPCNTRLRQDIDPRILAGNRNIETRIIS